MADYYDRLEEQLARATARGVPRRRLMRRPDLPRPRAQWLGVAAAVAVCVAVSLAVIVGMRSGQQPRSAVVPDHHHHAQPPMIRNYAPGKVPALGRQLFCDATFTPPRGKGSAKATMVVHTGSGASYVYSLTGRGLKPAPAGESYEVWTIPEINGAFGGYQLQRGVAPTRLGVITPPVAADGLLAARGTIPLSFSGTYRVLITVQPRSTKSPAHVVLRGDVPL
jgi:Anti-sigma-K factor rskA